VIVLNTVSGIVGYWSALSTRSVILLLLDWSAPILLSGIIGGCRHLPVVLSRTRWSAPIPSGIVVVCGGTSQ